MKRITLLLCVAAILAAGLWGGAGEETAAPTENPTEETTVPPVVVQTPEFEMSYSGQMKDLIGYAETEEGLTFSVNLPGGQRPIFTVRFHVMEGELVQMIDGPDGEKIPVSFDMKAVPENLSQEDRQTFCQAQDEVNAIIDSLKIK